jgi:hypothetical protein
MDESLEVDAPPGRIEGSAVQVEGDDVLAPDERGRHVPREQEVIDGPIVANARMSEAVDDTVPIKDAVGQDELID